MVESSEISKNCLEQLRHSSSFSTKAGVSKNEGASSQWKLGYTMFKESLHEHTLVSKEPGAVKTSRWFMKFLIGLCLMSALNANTPSASECSKWQSQVDASVAFNGMNPVVSKLSSEEKIQAISCLMELEGRHGTAKIGGVTRPDVSQVLPEVSIEIAALFYIRFIYLGKWDHCDGIALMDKSGKLNKRSAVKKTFSSYKKWFEKVKTLGIEEAKAKGLDPMDDCRDKVRWY